MLPQFVSGVVPHRFLEVDAARLLLILARFARVVDEGTRTLRCFPSRPATRHFTPEYYLQKLDFLLRYPGYFAYELCALFKSGEPETRDGREIAALVRRVITDREPELLTLPFQRFWRGAYERLDDVEAWWYARELVYTGQEVRGDARPQKHYFLSDLGLNEAKRLTAEVPHARWYTHRIDLMYRFFGRYTPADIKNLQYRHSAYREAQLLEAIPDLTLEEIRDAFADAFGEPLEVEIA